MLKIQIDNPELEKSIKQTYGNDTKSIAKAFSDFIQQQKLKQDIGVSITQLDDGKAIPMENVMRDIQTKYE